MTVRCEQLRFAWAPDRSCRHRPSLCERWAALRQARPEVLADLRDVVSGHQEKLPALTEVLRQYGLDKPVVAVIITTLAAAAPPAAPPPSPAAPAPERIVPESRSTTGRAQAMRYGRQTREDASRTDLRMAAHSLETARTHMDVAHAYAQRKDDLESRRLGKAATQDALALSNNALELIDEVLQRWNFQPQVRGKD